MTFSDGFLVVFLCFPLSFVLIVLALNCLIQPAAPRDFLGVGRACYFDVLRIGLARQSLLPSFVFSHLPHTILCFEVNSLQETLSCRLEPGHPYSFE